MTWVQRWIIVVASACGSTSVPPMATHAEPPRSGACPYVRESMVDAWDENEELWPGCSISSAIVSVAGRCTTGRYCMKPCESAAAYNGKVFSRQRYAYEPTGALREGQIVTILPNTGRTLRQSHACTYDGAHRTACTYGELVTTFTYDRGRLVGAQVARGDEVLEIHRHVYDAQGHLIRTEQRDGGATDFTYNVDGSLASIHEYGEHGDHGDHGDHGEVTRTLSYDGGRLARVDMTDGTVVDYRYDQTGRVTAQDTRAAASEEHVTYGYDHDGRLIERAWRDGEDLLTEVYAYVCR